MTGADGDRAKESNGGVSSGGGGGGGSGGGGRSVDIGCVHVKEKVALTTAMESVVDGGGITARISSGS